MSASASADIPELEGAVRAVSTLMRGHGGGLELVDASADGDVEVRFTGMCCGCPMRVATLNATILPRLRAVPGVRSVTAAGTRISAEAAARLAHYTTTTRRSPG